MLNCIFSFRLDIIYEPYSVLVIYSCAGRHKSNDIPLRSVLGTKYDIKPILYSFHLFSKHYVKAIIIERYTIFRSLGFLKAHKLMQNIIFLFSGQKGYAISIYSSMNIYLFNKY